MSKLSQLLGLPVVSPAVSGSAVLLAALSCVTSMPTADAAWYSGGTNTRILDTTIDPHGGADSAPIFFSSSGANSSPLVGGSSASSSVSVRTGGIHVVSLSESQVLVGPGTFYGQSEASGGFSDEFILSAPGVAAGTIVRATVAFGVSGALDGQGSGSGDGLGWGTGLTWRANFGLFAQNDGIRWDGEGRLSVDCCNTLTGGDLPGTRFFDLNVVVGETLILEMSASVEARSGAIATFAGQGPVEAIAYANFGNTMSWQGITSLTDQTGTPIGAFSALSPSTGFDYANAYVAAVPEPATWALWLCGLVGVVAGSRARSPRARRRKAA